MNRRQRNVLAAVLAIGFVAGLGLVVLGGDDPPASEPTPTTAEAPALLSNSGATLPLEDLSIAAVSELTGLAIPEDAAGYLTARLENERQLDVTFTLPAEEEAAFVRDSGLETPREGRRVILHSSPLWKLNPEDGAVVRGVSDTTRGVNRGVEFVDEGPGTVRVRVVVTAA